MPWTVESATEALVQCGLQENAAREVATSGIPLTYPKAAAILYHYLEAQDRNIWICQTTSEFRDLLRRLKFRSEVIPMAAYSSFVLPHKDARAWVLRFANGVYEYSAVEDQDIKKLKMQNKWTGPMTTSGGVA